MRFSKTVCMFSLKKCPDMEVNFLLLLKYIWALFAQFFKQENCITISNFYAISCTKKSVLAICQYKPCLMYKDGLKEN